MALNKLNPEFSLTGYEINKDAANQASKYNIAKIYNKSILEEITEKPSDLTFTVGVLIHINPDYRNLVYDNLVSKSKRYIVIVEYYNPSPVDIIYRGHKDKLISVISEN